MGPMLMVISPAKRLDFENPAPFPARSAPAFPEEAAHLVGRLRGYDVDELAELLSVSREIAEQNAERFRAWRREPDPGRSKAALFAYRGDVYQGLDADALDEAAVARAQAQLRILSGLYGVLRPLDAIQPYRLEMSTPLTAENGASLVSFWRERITPALGEAAGASDHPAVVNLASQEYAKAIDFRALACPVVEPRFKERKGGKLRTVAIHAKRARGRMAGWALRNAVDDPERLKDFAEDGYAFDPASSTEAVWVFARDAA